LDHLGLGAGIFDALGLGEGLDQATQPTPEMRIVTVGNAVKARVRNGLGFVNHQRYLVPRLFPNKPTHRLLAPGIEAPHLNDATLGRALDPLDGAGVTARYRLMAATAAQRLGLTPTVVHLDSTSFHVDGRDNSAEAPDAHVIHNPRGYSREHRPDLHHVRLDVLVEPQAGIPLLLKPRSGHPSDARDCGQVVSQHLQPLHLTSGTTYLVADSALYSEEQLQQLAHTKSTGSPRVPATLAAAQAALADAHPATMEPLLEGYR